MTLQTTYVSKAFLRDFAELANRYEWDKEEIEEMKAAVREGRGMREYISTLAKAHRDGYKQTPENGYIRLDVWLFMRGEELK